LDIGQQVDRLAVGILAVNLGRTEDVLEVDGDVEEALSLDTD